MTDLSQTPTEVLERARERSLEMQAFAIRAGLFRIAANTLPALAAINAELRRRQKDESK